MILKYGPVAKTLDISFRVVIVTVWFLLQGGSCYHLVQAENMQEIKF